MEYAVLVSASPSAVPSLMTTPISQEFTADLELSAEESHQLVAALLSFLGLSRTLQFE
jgi:hypothetical protein